MSRSEFRAILSACALAFGIAALSLAAAQTPREFAIAGYVFPRNSLLTPGQIDAHAVTRINYAFVAIQNGRLAAGSAVDAQNLAFLNGLKKQNRSLTLLVSVGGWLGSGEFSDVALSAQPRAVFVQSVIDFLNRYDLDGLDVDWEYPGMPGAGHPFRLEDERNFTLLLQDLRKAFDREEKTTGRRLVLTIAAGASDEYLAHTEMKQVQQYVDAVNLMSYDYAAPTADSTTGHNAPLFTNPAAPIQESADVSLRAFERAGVPSGKILLGVPFYGHVWVQVSAQNHGLFQPGKAAPGEFAPFSGIQQNMLGQGFTRYWDEAASAPYLYSAEKQEFVSYDDAESLAAKCAYVRTHNLGGVMFWEYSDDLSGVLLQTIDRALRQTPAPSR
jgi:chitinase